MPRGDGHLLNGCLPIRDQRIGHPKKVSMLWMPFGTVLERYIGCFIIDCFYYVVMKTKNGLSENLQIVPASAYSPYLSSKI